MDCEGLALNFCYIIDKIFNGFIEQILLSFVFIYSFLEREKKQKKD